MYAWWYSAAWQATKMNPRMTVAASQNMVLPRWFSRSAWWAIVSVTPELSSNAVLMVGSQKGPTVWKCSTTPAGPKLGHTAWKSGHSIRRWSMSPSHGVVMVRTYQSAPKNAAKNITSEKMNQLMPQRYDPSMRLLFMPASDSWMASPNQ
ncbi:Uncharacterised protein [Achromobacter xylosoxidans]|nr:Uncharacterised protein [Achromobacter xylosoxidans]CUJ45445.1 Uncharacterised protein [Achromobacter xylosoxidans]